MDWKKDYKKKLTTLEEAVGRIKSRDRIFISANAATPFSFLKALAARKDELFDVVINHVLLVGEDPFSEMGMEKHFRHNSLFVGPADRQAIIDGRGDYVPIFLHEIPRLFKRGTIPLDVAILHVSPPDEHGYMSYGVECIMSKTAAEIAKFAIAIVNDKMPRTLGDGFIHVSRVNQIVEVSQELPELPRRSPSEVELKIGGHIASLVDDGATLQLGIGGIPDAVLASLTDKKDLGIHTEMVSDGIVTLLEAGIITCRRKTIHTGKVVATFFFGSKELYSFIDNNPIFEVHPCDYTNDPLIIAQHDNMIAINSAIEVDITGQVCSDSIGPKIYSGFGGQVDFIRGASRAKGGKPIIALTSATKNDTVTKIVPTLKAGAGVVTSRADVHYVVTEYGIAELHGRNIRQRAIALIEIAHPKFRESLERYAYEQKYIQPGLFQVSVNLK